MTTMTASGANAPTTEAASGPADKISDEIAGHAADLTTHAAASMLAALGKPQRLEIFRRLVRAGPDGLTVGDIGAALDMPGATLAHHLGTLVRAGLVAQERNGRAVHCRPMFDSVDGLIAFLTAQCCADREQACHRQDGVPADELEATP